MIYKTILIITILLILPAICLADMVYTTGITGWQYIDTHKIILLSGQRTVAVVDLPFCFLYPTSRVRFLSDVLEYGEKILIDDEVCDVGNVKRIR